MPYLLRELDVPVYGPPYAMQLLRNREDEHPVLHHASLHVVEPGAAISFGPFRVSPIRVTHSIIDATALAIETPAGRVVHTGDFKIDDGGFGGQSFDMEAFAALGKQGVDLLMSDSTNIEREGRSVREVDVHAQLERDIEAARGAVFVGLFSSNAARLDALGKIAERTGRKLVLLGRGMRNHAGVARGLKRLSWSESRVWPEERVAEVAREKLLVLCTGTQAEPGGALGRLAAGGHRYLDICDGDTVLMSSRVIPGHEPEVDAMLDSLIRRGARVLTPSTCNERHASGHASRSEQAQMLELCAPRSFLPLHGRLRHLMLHADLARAHGSEACVIENGTEAQLTSSALTVASPFVSGEVRTWATQKVAPQTLSERRGMGFGGVVIVRVGVRNGGTAFDVLDVQCHGVTGDKSAPSLYAQIRRDVESDLRGLVHRASDQDLGACAVRGARRAAQRVLGFRPEIVTCVVRV